METSPGYIHQIRWFESDTLEGIVKKKLEITFRKDRIYPNGKKAPDGIEIRFGDARPTLEVRELLKAHGFRFSEKQTMWYAIDNAKSRELIEQLENTEVEVDDTKYQKQSFWKRIGSYEAYNVLKPYTEFMVHGEPPAFFRNKKMLEKTYGNIYKLLQSGLSFKKYFNKAVEEEGEEEGEESDSQIGYKLRVLADNMQKTIDAKINSAISKQRPTPRRARIAAGMREEGYRLRNIQSLLYALSNAHLTGKISQFPLLKEISTKAQAELLLQYENAYGRKENDEILQRFFDHRRMDFDAFGISNFPKWTAAIEQKNTLLDKSAANTSPKPDENAEKIRELEMQLLSQKIEGFFPTPPDLIEHLLELAELDRDDSILEPSAGKGDILDAISKKFEGVELDLSAIEINPSLQKILELKGYELIGTNFLTYNTGEKFNKIVMNPPFENGQDIDHVTQALKLLTPGGRVVAIMSEGVFFRSFKKDKAFRILLQEMNAYISQPIKEAFKQGFKSTGVTVRIVAINADGTPITPVQRNSGKKHPAKPQEEPPENQPQEDEEDQASQDELEAKAELELMRMQMERKRRKRNGLKGIEDIDPEKLEGLKRRAWTLQGYGNVLDFK
jgi:hypothetical protein